MTNTTINLMIRKLGRLQELRQRCFKVERGKLALSHDFNEYDVADDKDKCAFLAAANRFADEYYREERDSLERDIRALAEIGEERA